MIITRGYKTEIAPTADQRKVLEKHVSAARYIYNWALATRKQLYEEESKSINTFGLNKLLTELKSQPDHVWLYEVSNSTLQAAIRNLCKGFDNFFRRVKQGGVPGYPKFHSRYDSKQSFSLYGSALTAYSDRVKLPKIGVIRLKEKDYIPLSGRILAAHISCVADRWYVSVQIEQEVPDPPKPVNQPLGVHLGVRTLATCSNGLTYPNVKPLKNELRKLRRLEKEKSRRQKGSSNRAKTVKKIAKLHARVANVRNHNLHNVSASIIKMAPQAIVVESYDIQALLKDTPHVLARSMSDAGMGELRRQLAYKGQWKNIDVIATEQGFASMRTCSVCGNIGPEQKTKKYKCSKCGIEIDAELNAAMNLRNLAGKPLESINAYGDDNPCEPSDS
jgi:putative transposase